MYNEFDKFSNFDVLKSDIDKKCRYNKCNFAHSFNFELIKDCALRLKLDKKDPSYNVNSENIVYGTDSLFLHLTNVFNFFISHGVSTDRLNQCILVPIPKNKRKSLSESSNYRSIAVSSVIGKLFESILLIKLNELILPCDYQFGYKRHSSTTICSFILNQTVQYYKNSKSNVYCLFLDASKAFDRVQHEKLFRCLLDKGLCPILIRVIAKMYSFNCAKVKWGGKVSGSFEMSNGVKQGAILSPFLFNIYLEPLIDKIIKSSVGCHIGNKPVNIMSYADDLVVLTPTMNSLKKLVSILEDFSSDFNISFNPSKSFIMFYSNFMDTPNVDVIMNGEKINFVSEGVHLGFNLTNKKDNFFNITSAINDMYIRTNVLKRSFSFLSTECKVELFNTHCLSLYGCELWNLQDKDIVKLEIAWRKSIRSFLDIPYRTRSALIPGVVGTPSIMSIIHNRQINLISKGLMHYNKLVKFIFNNSIIFPRSYVIRNMNIILSCHEILFHDLFLRKKFKFKCENNWEWRLKIINELLHMRDYKCFGFLDANEIEILLNYICCF